MPDIVDYGPNRRESGAALHEPSRPLPRRRWQSDQINVQCFSILGNNKIFIGTEPAQRPWFGYPYAVVPRRARFSAQDQVGGGGGVNTFLVPGQPNDANIRHAALNTLSLRVSDDTNMAIENSDLVGRQPKTFFATHRIIADANRRLSAVNSIVHLESQYQHIKILTGRSTAQTKKLYRVIPIFNVNPSQNCDALAGQITGIGGRILGEGIYAVFATAARFLGRDSDPRTSDFDVNQAVGAYVKGQYWTPNRLRKLGGNAGASPGVGDAFAIATVGPATPIGGGGAQVFDIASKQTRTLNWAYHFAAVVIKSGRDRITLENYARGDNRQAGPDPRWYFQMYGEHTGQTFHEFHEARQEYANPLTVAVTNAIQAPVDPGSFARSVALEIFHL